MESVGGGGVEGGMYASGVHKPNLKVVRLGVTEWSKRSNLTIKLVCPYLGYPCRSSKKST